MRKYILNNVKKINYVIKNSLIGPSVVPCGIPLFTNICIYKTSVIHFEFLITGDSKPNRPRF